MQLTDKINAFKQLGKLFESFGKEESWPGFEIGLNEAEYSDYQERIEKARHYNGWFEPNNVRRSLLGLAEMIKDDKLDKWIANYEIPSSSKTVALITAGNIPLVGFHDILCVLLAGHKLLLRTSSEDAYLTSGALDMLIALAPEFEDKIEIATDKKMQGFDAVIATGSDNSSRYFEYYFGKYPNIIRKNRISVALIDGDEGEDEMNRLAKDVFEYYGLGCRNVSKLFVPQDFDIDNVFKGLYNYKEVINFKKWADNYDYQKAIHLMNKNELIENGFILLKEDESYYSPVGMLYFERYSDKNQVLQRLEQDKEKIQCVVGKEGVPFGKAQQPELNDYADNIDVMKFLTEL